MPNINVISNHYKHGTLLESIRAGIDRLAKSKGRVAPVEIIAEKLP